MKKESNKIMFVSTYFRGKTIDPHYNNWCVCVCMCTCLCVRASVSCGPDEGNDNENWNLVFRIHTLAKTLPVR